MMRGASTGGLFSVPWLRRSGSSPLVWLPAAWISYQRFIQGTSLPNAAQRSMAAGWSRKPVAAAQSSIWWP